jgi:hypothetical protein
MGAEAEIAENKNNQADCENTSSNKESENPAT